MGIVKKLVSVINGAADDEFENEVEVEEDEVEETEPDETERQIGDTATELKTDKGGNTGLIIGIAAGAVVVVAAVVVVLVVVKKKKN